jgi:hypothetical protein
MQSHRKTHPRTTRNHVSPADQKVVFRPHGSRCDDRPDVADHALQRGLRICWICMANVSRFRRARPHCRMIESGEARLPWTVRCMKPAVFTRTRGYAVFWAYGNTSSAISECPMAQMCSLLASSVGSAGLSCCDAMP